MGRRTCSGNGNGKIENGEAVELQVFVENTGVGDANGVKFTVEGVTPFKRCDSSERN